MTPEDRRVIGARLRKARTERGWTQARMAQGIAAALADAQAPDLDTLIGYVKRWERGKTGIRTRYREGYATALGTSVDELFTISAASSPEDDPVLRRNFLGASVALTGLAVMAPEISDHAQRIGASTVQKLRRRTVRLRRLDDVLGGGDTWPVYASELALTRRLVDDASYTLETGRELLGVVAEQAQQAGWAALDAGRPDTARALFRDSMTAATDAGDPALMANALALLSYQKLLVGAPGTEEADASCRVITREAPGAVRALLYERAAWSYAVAGPEHTPQVEYSLRQAEAALAEDSAGSADPDWAAWVDEIELQIMTGRCWSTLRQPKRAVPALQWALARYDDAHARDKALYLTWLAEAHMDAGDLEESARTLARAVDLASDVASARPQRRIQAVLDRLRPHRMLEAVAEVFELAAPSPRTSSA
ncbi:hypothetical protein ACQP1W_14895 [Spirillospora sp. CA-255316]